MAVCSVLSAALTAFRSGMGLTLRLSNGILPTNSSSCERGGDVECDVVRGGDDECDVVRGGGVM